MPWYHCDVTIIDSAPICPTCGVEKRAWTVRLNETRVFVSARTWIEVCLTEEDGSPVPNELYQIELPSGKIREGRLDAEGVARVDKLGAGTCRISFPNREVTAVTAVPEPPAPAPVSDSTADWLKLELLDAEGKPAAGERYRVEDSAGAVREGTLDGQGSARLEGLSAGECQVTFPDHHGADLERLAAGASA